MGRSDMVGAFDKGSLLFIIAIEPLCGLLQLATEQGLISKLRGRNLNIKSIKEDVDELTDLLKRFGEPLGLTTNSEKSSVVPIRRDNIDLGNVLNKLPAIRTCFPDKYLALPLTTG